jgi:hypothetical protein
MGQYTLSAVIAPLLGAAVFGGMLAYGMLTGNMPASRFGGEAGRTEMPAAFWILGGIYAAGSVACFVWFMVSLLN